MAHDDDLFEGREWSLFREDAPRKTVAPYWAIVLAALCGIGAALVMFRLYAGS